MIRAVNKKSAGFTLIETLVAIMLLAISMTSIMQLFSGGIRSIRVSNEYERAIFYAQELIEEILLAPSLAEETRKGQFEDGFRWSMKIQALDTKSGYRKPGFISRFYIKTTVEWPVGARYKQFDLDTMCMAPLRELDSE